MGADQVVELLERDVERAALASALEDARSAGRIAVVVGEAGIGKTSLVSTVCAGAGDRRVLWGACDPLITPRPLGPLRDAGAASLPAIAGAGAREAVLAAALDELAAGVRRIPRGPRPAPRAAPGGLTPREREVLDLLVAGATNAQIAQTLVIAPKTVDHHVSAVLGKLGVTSRREAGTAPARLDAGHGGSPTGAR